MLVFYNISFSRFLPLDGFQFNFLQLRDSENDLQRENHLHKNPQNGHKSARGPHRRDVTHILSKVSCFLLKSFHFRRLEKRQVFSYTNPYILNVTQQCRRPQMLIFRAWATCDINYRFPACPVSCSEFKNSIPRQLLNGSELQLKVEIEFYEVSHITVSLRNVLVLSSLIPYQNGSRDMELYSIGVVVIQQPRQHHPMQVHF